MMRFLPYAGLFILLHFLPVHTSFGSTETDSLLIKKIEGLIASGRSLSNINPDSAVELARSAKELSWSSKYHEGLFNAYVLEAIAYRGKKEYKIAEALYDSAIILAAHFDESRSHVEKSRIMLSKGFMLNQIGDQLKATDVFIEVIKYAEENGLTQQAGEGYYRVADIYRLQREGEKALEYFLKARSFFEEVNNQNWLFYTDDMIFHSYDLRGDTQAGVNGLISLFDTYKDIAVGREAARTWNNIGRMFLRINQFDSAEIYLLKARAEYLTSGTTQSSLAYNLNELLTLNKLKGNYDKALDYGLESVSIAEEIQAIPLLRNIYNHLSEVYEAKGLFKESLEAFRKHKIYSDSVGNADKVASIDRLRTEFDFEQQRKDAAQVAALLEKDKFIALNQRNWALLGGVLLVIIVALIYRAIIDRKEKKSKIALTHALIDTQEAERKRIAKEMHDGIGQSLLMLKNQMKSQWELPDSELGIIEQTIAEVRTISQNLHPYQLERLGLTKALESIIDQLDKHTTLFVSAEIDNIDGDFESDEAINIYRTVQELFSNILKHSGATSAKLLVQRNNSELSIQVFDNGKGFEYNKSYSKIGSLGLKTLKERIEMLNGEIKFEVVEPKGTKVDIKLPLKANVKTVQF